MCGARGAAAGKSQYARILGWAEQHGVVAARDLVFGVGDKVRTWGRFVSGPDGDWLDVARVHDLVFREPGWKSDRSVRLIGLVAEAIPVDSASNRRLGYISVVGIWRDGSIEVESFSGRSLGRSHAQFGGNHRARRRPVAGGTVWWTSTWTSAPWNRPERWSIR